MRTWESYLEGHFPGYLLPDAARTHLSADAAQRFLTGISGRTDLLRLLRAIGTLMPRATELATFVEELATALRTLPSTSHRERRTWNGGFHGRLDVAPTLAHHLRGERTTFVTGLRRRTFDLPENRYLKATCERLLAVLSELRGAGLLRESGWATELRAVEGRLRHLLATTLLKEVPSTHCGPEHEAAALAARPPIYRSAVVWQRNLRNGLDSDDPARIADVVAQSALLPLAMHTRFELAAAMRLCEALHEALERSAPGEWRRIPSLVVSGRRDITAFEGPGGSLRLFYNQAVLESGAGDLGAKYYLGNDGVMRPDLVLTWEVDGRRRRATVFEIKHSNDIGYLTSGFHEALLYRWEYAEALTGHPKAVLVTSAPIAATPRAGDDVVACDWEHWPTPWLVDALVSEALAAGRLEPLLAREDAARAAG